MKSARFDVQCQRKSTVCKQFSGCAGVLVCSYNRYPSRAPRDTSACCSACWAGGRCASMQIRGSGVAIAVITHHMAHAAGVLGASSMSASETGCVDRQAMRTLWGEQVWTAERDVSERMQMSPTSENQYGEKNERQGRIIVMETMIGPSSLATLAQYARNHVAYSASVG